jgi:hypothetical protein
LAFNSKRNIIAGATAKSPLSSLKFSSTFNVQFFTAIFSELSGLVVDDTIEINFNKISAQTLSNERNKWDFFSLNHKILGIYYSKSHSILNFCNTFIPELSSLFSNDTIYRKNWVLCAQHIIITKINIIVITMQLT